MENPEYVRLNRDACPCCRVCREDFQFRVSRVCVFRGDFGDLGLWVRIVNPGIG